LSGRQLNKLNARQVATLSKHGRHSDGGNLYLVVGPGDAKRWVFLYRAMGRLREMGLGSTKAVSLARAREKAALARAQLADGLDPLDMKRRTGSVPLFGPFADEVRTSLEAQWRNAKHRQQWRTSLECDALPLRAMPVNTITTEDVLRVLKPIWTTKAETASRVRGRIERVLDAAIAKGFFQGQNPARWKGHLDSLLPARQKLQRGHHPAMGYREIPRFMGRLQSREGFSARALEFLVFTAARSGEVREARWNEFDLSAGIWTIPAARMKAGREHRVPLTPSARASLLPSQRLNALDPQTHVFPGNRGGPLSDMSLTAVLRRMGISKETATVHGFRSSFRDWAGEESHHPREVAEAALAHIVGDETERAYRRGDALEKRRALMNDWATFAAGHPNGDAE
jgi:integrase